MALIKQAPHSFELGPIRPPSEAYSLLIRVTRNCPWNRCKFCHTYKGERFQLRSVEEVKQDIKVAKVIQDEIKELSWKSGYGGRVKEVASMILNNPPNQAYHTVALWFYAGGESAFLQDANSLIMRTNELAEVIRFLKQTLPSINRVTSYARSKTAAKKKLEELIELHEAGLSRLHIGLESGYDPLLQYMDKGVTAAEHIEGGRKVVASGISLCEYVVLGLGGTKMWREHANQTARVLNEIETGNFIRSTDEEILTEEKLFLKHLECRSTYVSDHITNLLPEIEGKLPQDKERMLAIIDSFQSLPPKERTNFIVGRRVGIYIYLDDLCDVHKHQVVEQIIHKLIQSSNQIDDKTIYSLMEGFI